MFQTIKQLWSRESLPNGSDRDPSARRMEMNVESLESRVMLSGVSLAQDTLDPVEPLVAHAAPPAAEVALATESTVDAAVDSQLTLTGNVQTIVLNLNDGPDTSVNDSQVAESSNEEHSVDYNDTESSVEKAVLVAPVAVETMTVESSEIVRESTSEANVTVARTMAQTAPEQNPIQPVSEPVFESENGDSNGSFEFLVGHEMRGPPMVDSDPTSDFMLFAPLSSNASNTDTCDDLGCPCEDGSDAVCEDGTLEIGSGSTLGGNQTIDQTVVNDGLVSPGNSPGILVFASGYTQTANGTLLIELFGATPGTGHDQIQVTGDVDLDGLLRVVLDSDFAGTLTLGDEFVILTYTGTVTGDFADHAGLGIPGTSLYLRPIHNSATKQITLKVESVTGSLTGQIRAALRDALNSFGQFGDRIEELLAAFRQPLPILGMSLADLVNNATGQDLASFLDLSTSATALANGTNNTLTNLISVFQSQLDGLTNMLDREVISVSAYTINNELHVEFIIDLAQSFQVAGLDLNTILPTATLTQLGLDFDSDIDLDTTVGVYANFGIVIDISNPTSISNDAVEIEITDLRATLDVDTDINGLSVNWTSFGTSLAVTGGAADANEITLAVTLSQLDYADRMTLTELNALVAAGLAPATQGTLRGAIYISLPVTATFAGNLVSFGSPILLINQSFEFGTHLANHNWSLPTVTVDLNLTTIKTQILGLLDQLSSVRPDLSQLPFALPASFDVAGLFDGIASALNLKPVAERLFNILEAFNIVDVANNLPQFRSLLGLDASFDSITGTISTNVDLQQLSTLLETTFGIELPAGDLTFSQMRAAVFGQLGSFVTMGRLIEHLQAALIDASLNGSVSLFGLNLTGGYDSTEQEIRLDLKFDYEGVATFTNVALTDLSAMIFGSINDLKNNGVFKELLGVTADLSTAPFSLDSLDGAAVNAQSVTLEFGGSIDASLGLDLSTIIAGTGMIGSDLAFLRLNELTASAAVSIDAAIVAINFGDSVTVVFNQIEFNATVGTLLTAPGSVLLSDLIAGTTTISAFIAGLSFDPTGSLHASLAISTQSLGGSFDTAIFGVPRIVVDDPNLFDGAPLSLQVSVLLGTELKSAILSLATQWDTVLNSLFNNPVMNAILPLLDRSANQLIGGSENGSLAGLLSLQTVASDYFTSNATTATVAGLIDAWSAALSTRFAASSLNPFSILGGFSQADEELSFDFELDIEQSFGVDINVVTMLANAGPTAAMVTALTNLGVTLTGDFILEVLAAVEGKFTFVVDLSGFMATPSTAITTSQLALEMDDSLLAMTTISASSINMGVTLTSGTSTFAPRIEGGDVTVLITADMALKTALNGSVTVAQLIAGPLNTLFDFTLTGSLDSRLPILGLFDAIDAIDGTFVLRVVDNGLFDAMTSLTTTIEGEFAVSEFVYVRGSISGFSASTVTVTLDDATTTTVSLLTVGIADADLFVGINGPTGIDLDGNGTVDAHELNSNAAGLVVTGANLGLALMTATDAGDDSTFLGIVASASTLQAVGLPADFQMTFTNLDFVFNYGSNGKVVDFAMSDFDADGSADGSLVVPVGANSVTLDMTSAILSASADVTMNLGGFVYVAGSFAFALGATGEVVVDETGVSRAVSILTIGGYNVNVGIGSMKSDGSGLEMGLLMTGTSFGIAILSTIDPNDDNTYFAMSAAASSVSLVGLPTDITIAAQDVQLRINTGSDGAVDFIHANTTFGGTAGPLSVATGGQNLGVPVTVDLDFAGEFYEASAKLILSLGNYVMIDGLFAFRRGPAQMVTLSDGSEKQVTSLTIGGTNVNAFVGIGGPYQTDTNGDGVIDGSDAAPSTTAQGFVLTNVDFGLVIMSSQETGDDSVYYALQATIGSFTLANIPDFAISTGLVTIQLNDSTDASGAVVNFATSAFDGPDEGTDPDGYLEVLTGGAPIQIAMAEKTLRVEVLSAAVTVTILSTDHTISGNFAFEIGQDAAMNDQFVVGVTDLTYAGASNAVTGAIGVMVVKSAGVALLVYGEFDASAGVGITISAGLGLVMNSTGGVVNEMITVAGQTLTINSTVDEVRFIINNLTLNIADFVFVEGTFLVNQPITIGANTGTFQGGTVELFMGLGPYKLPGSSTVNPDAVGVLVSNAVVGLITLDGIEGYALWAEGNVTFIGLDGVVVSGTVRVEVNTTGVSIIQDVVIVDPISSMTIGTAAFNFATTAVVKKLRGTDVTIGVPGVFELSTDTGGYVEFSKLANDMVEVDIAKLNLRVLPQDATSERFSIQGHATFTIGKQDGFKLRYVQVYNFSIFDLDAGIQTGTDPPAELAQMLGFPDVTVGVGGAPVAAVINPLSGATVDAATLNARGFIDITFSVGTTGILDSAAEFTLTGNGVTADLTIDNANVVHLYGTTYRYQLIDANPNNSVGLFSNPTGSTAETVTVSFIAGSFTNSITNTVNVSSTDNFKLLADSNTASAGAMTFTIGPVQIVGPTISLEDFSYTNGKLLLTIGLGANQVNLGFGSGQSESGVTAQLTNVLVTFDIELGFDLSDLSAFIANPLGHVTGPSLTGKFSFRAQTLKITIPNILEVSATAVLLAYDPAVTGSQTLLSVAQTTIKIIPINLTSTINNLSIRNDGFSFDDATLAWDAGSGTPISFGGLFEFSSFGVTITDFDITFGQAFVFAGSVTFFTDDATFLPGKAVSATVSKAPGSTLHGLSATLNFGADGTLESLQFHIDQIEVKFGSFLTFVGTNINVDTAAWGNASQTLVSFSSIGAKLKLGSLIVGGEARNFSFTGDGTFVAGMNFAVIISVDAVTGSSVKWPSWLPIQITEVGLQWADINNDPSDFVLILSASVTGLHNLPLTFSGAITGIKIDVGKLTSGAFPIIDIESIAVSVSGDLFGGQLTAALLGGILKLDAAGNVLDSLATENQIAERIFFFGVEGGFNFPGIGGLTIRFAVSELGPLGVFINVNVPGGILIVPQPQLAINDFSAGVEFFTSLPDYTDPFDLRNSTFGLPTDMTAAQWLTQVKDQVAAQWLAFQANPNMSGFVAAFTETMTITGGAKLFTRLTSEEVFNGEVIIKFSTDGKFALSGKLNFAADNLSVSAKMYANLSNIASGNVTLLFLAEAPDQAPIVTLFGALTFEFIPNAADPLAPLMVLKLNGGIIYQAPLGVIGDLTGADIQDVELFRIDGGVTLTLDLARPAFTLDLFGTMSMVYLGPIGSAAGRLVLELPTVANPLAPPKLWGVIKLESGLDKLAQLGLEVKAEILLQVNTTTETKIEVLTLPGIVGDAITTVMNAAALAELDALNIVVPPAGLPAVPSAVGAMLTAAGITLSANSTIEVVIVGASWRVHDEDNLTTYFIEETTSGALKISGESQTFTLAPLTFGLEIRGELIFHLPAFLPDGITPGPDVFVLAGVASVKINRDGLEAFVIGRLSVGPASFRLLEFNAQGALVINNTGIAAGLSVSLAVTNVPGIDLTGNLSLVLNTTNGAQTIAIPQRFQTLLLPPPPTVPPGAMAGDLIPTSTTNASLFWRVDNDLMGLTPVLVVPGTAPDINGMVDLTAPVNTPFAVIRGDGVLRIRPAGVDLLTMTGKFHLTLEPSRLSVLAAYGVAIPVLGSATGTASFVLDADGMYGQGQVTRDVGGAAIPGVNMSLSMLLEFNTSGVAKEIQTFAVDQVTGTIGADLVTVSLPARQLRIVAGGSLTIGDLLSPLVSLTGRFEMYVNTSELAISVAARLALGDGSINADVTGAALLRADGIAFQILATVATGTSSSHAGSGFRVELGGAALVRINTINQAISTIAGVTVDLDAATGSSPYFDVQLNGAGLIEFTIGGVGGFKIQGEISTQVNSDGFAISIDGEFTATLGGTVLLRMSASGSFQIFGASSFTEISADDGIAGKIALAVESNSLLSGTGFDIAGTFTLEVNTTGNAITDILGTTVNLAAGPFARIAVSGVIKFSFGGAASFELRANGAGQGFAIEMNATRIAITADADLVAVVGGQSLITLSITNGLLALGTDGIVANIDLGGSIGGNLFSFSGTTKFKLNTTGENVFINNGVVLPGVHISINGSLTLLSGFQLNGQFAIELNSNGLVIDANADLTVTVGSSQLVSLELIDSFLQITNNGIAAKLSVGGRLSGPGFEFRSSTIMTLLVNTTGQSVSSVNGRSVGLTAGYYAKLSLVGDLVFLNAITIKGSFMATVASDGLDVSLNGTLSVMSIGFNISAAARIRSGGIAFKASVSLSAGGNTLKPISGLSIQGSFALHINTMNVSQLGLTARSAGLHVAGNINVKGFTLASVTFDVSVSSTGFSASFSGTLDVGILNVGVSGSFSSNGTFSVTGSVSVSVTAGPAYLNGTASVTINNSGFSMHISGSAGLRIAGINIGVSVSGNVSVSSNGSMRISVSACVTINLLFTSFDVCATVTFGFGSRPGTPPSGTNTTPPPSLGSVSAGALSLNLNQFGSGDREITIISESGGLRVSGNGFSQVFSGVTSISLNLGGGNDYLYIGQNVTANVTINGQGGDDEIIYLGSGTATIDGGDGNDEIRVIDDRNFRAEPNESDTALPSLATTGHTLNGGAGDDILIGGSEADTINGGTGDDRIDGRGGNDTVTGGDGVDIIYGGSGNDNLQGGAGNDVLYGEQGDDTLDGGAGNDVMLGGAGNETILWTLGNGVDIEINGQSGQDVINVTGSAANNTFAAAPGETGAFVMTIDGQGLTASNFETVNILGLAGSDSITMVDLSGTGVQQVTVDLGNDTVADSLTIDGLPTNNTYTMSVSGANVLVTPTGGTVITIIGAGTASGGATLTLNSAAGNDTINVEQTLAGTTNTINTGVGNDTVTVGDAVLGLSAIAGALTINGEDHDDTLNFEDSINTNASNATLNASTFVSDRFAAGQVSFSDIEFMDFDFGSGNDTLTVNVNAAVTNVDLAGGDDTMNIRNSAGNMTVTGGAGADTFYVGSTTNSVAGIGGTLTIDGQAGADAIHIDNSGGTTANDITITNNNVSFATDSVLVNYDNFEALTVSSGGAADQLTINTTHSGTTTVNTGAGGDTLSILTVSGPTTINTGNDDDLITVSSAGGTLNSIAALLTVNAGNGNDTLNLDDSGDTANNTGTLSATQLTGFGLGSSVTYGAVESLNLNLGTGHDVLTIADTSTATNTIDLNAGDDVVLIAAISGATTVHGRAGNESVTVGTDDLLNNVSALLTLNGDGGSNTVSVSDSADTTSNTGSVTSTTIRGLGMSNGIDYFDFNSLDLTLGSGSDNLTILDLSGSTVQQMSLDLGNDGVNDTVTFNGLAGDDEYTMTVVGTNLLLTPTAGTPITISRAGVAHGGATLTLNSAAGDDTLNIVHTLAGTTNTINTGAGSDTINVGNITDALTAIAGVLTINGNGEQDTLNVEASVDTAGITATLNANTLVSGSIAAGLITFNEIEIMDVAFGSGDDTLTVNANVANTTIDLADGNDTMHIRNTAGDLSVTGGNGVDTFNVGSVAPVGGSTVNGIVGLLTIDGQGGSDAIHVDNAGDLDANDVSITDASVTFNVIGSQINYAMAETLTVNTGFGADQVVISSTHSGTTTVNSAAGNDRIDVLGVAGVTTLETGDGDDEVNVGSVLGSSGVLARGFGGVLDDILAQITITAGPGNDTLNLDDSGDTDDNVGTLTATTLTGLDMIGGIVYFGFDFLNLDLGSGNDTLTIDDTSSATNTIDLGAGNDTLLIEAISGTTTVFGQAGDDAMTVGTDDLLDNVSALLTLDGNDGTNTLTISDSSDTNDNTGILNGTMLRGLEMANGIDYFNFASLDLTLGSGSDDFTITTTHAGTTAIDTANGADTVLIEETVGLVNLNTGAGDDTILVGKLAAGGRTIAGIDGVLNIDGQGDDDSIHVDNSADLVANQVTLTNSTLAFAVLVVTVNYSNTEALEISTGSGNDQVTIQTTHVGTTTVNTAAGNDTLAVLTISGETTLNTGTQDDTITVTDTAPTAGGVLDSILGLLTVNAGDGSDTLNVDDSGDVGDNVGRLTATTITGLDMSNGIVYGDFEFLNLDLGSGNDTLTIDDTSSATNTIDLGAGNDTLLIEAISGTTTVFGQAGNDAMTVGTDDLLDNVSALLTLHGNDGTNTLAISDSGDADDNVGSLNATMLRGLELSQGIDYFDFATLDLTLGSGNDDFTVTETHSGVTTINTAAGNDSILIEEITGLTNLNAGNGDDSIIVGEVAVGGRTLVGIDGVLNIDGQGGDDSIHVDNSADLVANNVTLTNSQITFSVVVVTVNYLNTESLEISLGAGDDQFTLQTTHAGTTTVNTAAGNDVLDVLTISGDTTLNTGSDNDTITVTDTAPSAGGVLDSILALLIINAGVGTDTLNIDDSGDADDNVGTLTATTLTGLDMSDGIVYANFEFLNLDLGSGHDTLTIEDTSSAVNVIDLAAGNDTLLVAAISGTTTVFGRTGDEAITVGNLGTLDAIAALLTLFGNEGTNSLTVSDAVDTSDNTGSLNATMIRGLDMSDGIDYFGFATLTVLLGVGNDQFTVMTTHVGTTTLNTGAGDDSVVIELTAGTTTLNTQEDDDTIVVEATNSAVTINAGAGDDNVAIETIVGPLTINGDAGDDTVLVGYVVDGQLLPTIDHLQGVLTVNGNDGSDTLTLDDRGDATDRIISVDGDAVDGLTESPIGYFTLEYLNILAGSGDDVLNVRGTTANTYIELNDGDERIFVSSDANADFVTANTIDFLTGHLDLLLGGDLDIRAGNGRHKLMISDEADTTGDTATITDSTVAGMEIVISGLATSNVSYGASATGNFADGITIWTGWGHDAIDVDATHYRAALDVAGNTIRTITSLNTGLGDDTITVTLLAGTDGFFALNSQGPYNDQPTVSDKDTIDASASTLGLYLFGGQDDDQITGGQGRDIIFGDRGVVLFFSSLPTDVTDWNAIEPLAVTVLGNGGPGDRTDGIVHEPALGYGRDVTVGGNDTIRGGDGDDFLLGQNGNDQIFGEDGEDDIIGGHNIIGGPDGDDFLDGGDDADVIIGDNGSIIRVLNTATGDWERYAAPFDDVIREIQLFDMADGIGGDDMINGGAGDDILFGQIGDDRVEGGGGDDEIVGGLGDNTLIGGDDNDILVGGVAQIIRVYNEDGTVRLNSNGSWHRDVVLELVGTVIGYVDIDDTPEEFELLALAEQLLVADLWLIVGTFDADGNRVDSGSRTGWKTRILLIDLDAAGNETIEGGAGDDVIVGGLGNDTLDGGSGNDLIIGDMASNLSPYDTDLPLMLTGIRLRADATGTLDLDQFGTFVVPDVALETAYANTTTPHLTIVPETAPHLFDIATGDFIRGSDGAMLAPYVSIVPDVRNAEYQPGNDTIDGGEGDDTIIGDNLTIYSPLLATHVVIQAAVNALVAQLANLQVALYHMASLSDIANTHINGAAAGNRFTIGGDIIDGGGGNDRIVGDNAIWQGPSVFGLPDLTDGGDIVAQTITFHRHVMDLIHVVSDADHAVGWANQQAHRALRQNDLLKPRTVLNRNELWMFNDDIQGGDGNDLIVGDDSIVNMSVVTSSTSFRSRQNAIREAFGRKAVRDINREIVKQSRQMLTRFKIHVIRERKRLVATAAVKRDAGRVSFDMTRSNDTIDAGSGDDAVVGDTLVVGQPAFNVTPESRPERARLRGQLRRIINRARLRGLDYLGSVNYRVMLRIPRRGPTSTWSNDNLMGGDGNDVLVGDNADMSPFSSPRTDFVANRYEIRSRPKLGRGYVNTHRGGDDTIDGGAGDDKLDGRAGFDHLIGGSGADEIYGGAHRDTIDSDADDTRVRQGGRLFRETLVDVTPSPWVAQLTAAISAHWSQMDAKSPLWIWIRLRR